MSSSIAHSAPQIVANMYPVFEFGTNPFLIWNAELGDYCAVDASQWQFDYSTIPQMPSQQSSNVFKQIANPADIKTPMQSAPTHGQLINLPMPDQTTPTGSDNGLGISNVVTTPARSSRSPVPAIVTQFASRANTIDQMQTELFDSMPANCLPVSGVDQIQYRCNITPPAIAYTPNSALQLQEPFQWNSPITRRTSISSNTSGPVFSHLGTPVSTYQLESVHATPRTFQRNLTPQSASSQQFPQWSPRSPNSTWQPQSRKHSAGSFSRMSQQYLDALQKSRGGISMTMPSRRKPKIEHCLSESSLMTTDHLTMQPVPSRAVPGRRRAASAVNQRPRSASNVQTPGQLPLPMFQPDHISASPAGAQSVFHGADLGVQASPAQPSLTPYYGFTPFLTQEPQQQISLTPPPVFARQARPCDPPASDFHGKPQDQIPVYQAPQFDGDIYTPQYKRRNAKGEWEGWCGLCQPGQWHNLKNSRYWDDKLRNHGICARTKQKFDDPKSIRVVDLDGKVIDVRPERDERGELRGDEWVVSGLDGSLRKREGLCGCCGEWIAMDGVRTKAKGKSAGWWSHAYKCHERGRRAEQDEVFEHASQNITLYHTPDPFQQSQFAPHNPYIGQQGWI